MSDRNQYWRRSGNKVKPWRGGKSRSNDNSSGSRKQAVLPITADDPPRLSDLQHQNRVKTRRFFLKKQPQINTPHAPRNTSSFIMRAKTSGGIAPFVSPTPTTPAVLATPDLSRAPSYREGLVDEVKKEWGVNGYGSMNGLIRLRSSEEMLRDESESDSDVDSVQQLEQRLDQDLNRFEIVYPPEDGSGGFGLTGTQVVEDQDARISQLEEENLLLKERIFLLEQQVEELKQQAKSRETGESVEEMEVCSEKSVGDAFSAGQ